MEKRLRKKKIEQAIILSAMIFPGSGHLLLRRYFVALLLISVASIASYFLLSEIIMNALAVAEGINRGTINPSISEIVQRLTEPVEKKKLETINLSTAVLLIAWLTGIVDCFRIFKNEKLLEKNN